MAEQAAKQKKAAPKRKAAAKRKPTAKRKPAAKRPAAKKATAKVTSRAQETSRNVFLAGLGFYGKAFDQAQERIDSMQSDLEARRKKADKLYKELVKRGKKVEKDAQKAMDDLDLPNFDLDSLTDRKKLEAQLDKAKARLEEIRESVGLKSAA